MQEMQVQSLGWEDPLKEMVTHSSILAWRISWTEEPGRLQSMESQRIRHDRATEHVGTAGLGPALGEEPMGPELICLRPGSNLGLSWVDQGLCEDLFRFLRCPS